MTLPPNLATNDDLLEKLTITELLLSFEFAVYALGQSDFAVGDVGQYESCFEQRNVKRIRCELVSRIQSMM